VTEPDTTGMVELSAEDADDFDALYAELRGVPGIAVRAVPTPVEPGDQGAMLDLLTVALSGGTVTAFLEIIKTLLESRGPGFVLKLRHGRNRLEITAETIDEALPLIKELLRGA
jgi:Effector Associated Constant Component 1